MTSAVLDALGFLLQERPYALTEFLHKVSFTRILSAVLVIVLVYLLVRLSGGLLRTLARRAPRSRLLILVLAPLVRFALWFGGVFFILVGILTPSRDTLLAALASGAVALGLGAQDLLKNLVGGFVILADRPYQVGDRVKIGEAYGVIDQIGLRSTKLITPNDTLVTIPNSQILTAMAWNANAGAVDCLVVTDLYLPVDASPSECLEIAQEAAYSSPFVLLSKPVTVLLEDHFQYQPHLIVRVKAYVYDHRQEPFFQSDITLRAKTEFVRRGQLTSWC